MPNQSYYVGKNDILENVFFACCANAETSERMKQKHSISYPIVHASHIPGPNMSLLGWTRCLSSGFHLTRHQVNTKNSNIFNSSALITFDLVHCLSIRTREGQLSPLVRYQSASAFAPAVFQCYNFYEPVPVPCNLHT